MILDSTVVCRRALGCEWGVLVRNICTAHFEMKGGVDGWRPSSALTALGTTRHERTAAHIAAADSSRRAAAAVALVAAGTGRQPYAMALGKTTIFGPMGVEANPSAHRMRTKGR